MVKLINPKENYVTGEKLREALLTANTTLLAEVMVETFGKIPTKTESLLLKDAIDVYSTITGVAGAQTVGKVMKGTHSQHKFHPCHGKFRGAPHSEADLTRLGGIVHYALVGLTTPKGDAFGPDHTFQVKGMSPELRNELLAAMETYHASLPGTEPDFRAPAPTFTKKDASKATKELAPLLAQALRPHLRDGQKQISTYNQFLSTTEDKGDFITRYQLLHRYEGKPSEGFPATIVTATFRVKENSPKKPTVNLDSVECQFKESWDDKSHPKKIDQNLTAIAHAALKKKPINETPEIE